MTFFEKYYQHMLVINGVDAQTNSHTVGIVHNWSGRNSEGYPTLSALLAAYYAPALPIPYLSFGGFSVTSGITRFTRIDNANLLRDIAYPATDMSAMRTGRRWSGIGRRLRSAWRRRRICCRGMYAISTSTSRRSPPRGLKAYADVIPPRISSSKRMRGRITSGVRCAGRRS